MQEKKLHFSKQTNNPPTNEYNVTSGRNYSFLYYALLQIEITICNPPSKTAGGAKRSVYTPLPKHNIVVLCNRGQCNYIIFCIDCQYIVLTHIKNW